MKDDHEEALENIQEQVDAGYDPDEITVEQQIEADRDALRESIKDESLEIARESGIEGEA